MPEDDSSISKVLSAQDPIVRDILHEELEHGVLIPLKTTLELRDDHVTGRVLITRCPVKSANPAIRYVDGQEPAPSVKYAHGANTPLYELGTQRLTSAAAYYATCYLRKSLRAFLIYADAPSHATSLPISRRNS
jgi:hypothetical protein